MNGASGSRPGVRPVWPPAPSTGLTLAVLAAVISGVAVWINTQAVTRVELFGDAGTYTTAKNLVAAVVVVAVALSAGRRQALVALRRPARRVQWWALLAVSLVGGSVPFLLFFEGLARSGSPVDAQAVHKASLVVLVAVLGPALLRERLGPLQGIGLTLVVVGYLLMGEDLRAADTAGLLLVLGAAALWAVEAVLDRWLLGELSVATVAVARLGAGALWLVVFGLVTGDTSGLARLGVEGWAWAAVTGVVLAGYTACWLGALAGAQAVDVTAVLALAVPVTAVVNAVAEGTPLSPWYVLALLVLGAVVVAAAAWNRPAQLLPVWGDG